jgi:hypothetical protein
MEANMLRKLGFSALMLCSSLLFAQPQTAQAAYRHDDRYENRYEGRRDDRRLVVEHRDGYYDRFGCWQPYRYR